jgi:hypothetical protein
MSRLRITIGLAVAVCAMFALTSPAFAKEKLVFGEFQGSVTGKNLETEPQPVEVFKEDKELEVEGLQLGNYKFYTRNKAGEKEESEPCLKSPTIKGSFQAEPGTVNKSKSLPLDITFKKCMSHAGEGGVSEGKAVTFTLPIALQQNFSAEAGPKIAGVEIPNKTTIEFKGTLRKCPVVIPQQTIPFKASPEKEFEEVVSYTNEAPEEIENWEKSKKLKEQFPTGFKERLEVEFEEKFKGIHTYVKATPPCEPAKGEDNPKLITEGPEGPNHGEYNGWLEYTSGHIFMDVEGLEIKGGELSFVGG